MIVWHLRSAILHYLSVRADRVVSSQRPLLFQLRRISSSTKDLPPPLPEGKNKVRVLPLVDADGISSMELDLEAPCVSYMSGSERASSPMLAMSIARPHHNPGRPSPAALQMTCMR